MDKKKLFYIAIAVIIILGIISVIIWGFNVGLAYREHKEVDIYIGKEFENKEIEKIAKEILNDKDVYIEKVELYEDMVAINANEITQEQLEELNNKLNEKYELENKVDELSIITIPKARLLDKVTRYIIPVIISAIVVCIYVIIRYRELGILNILLKTAAMNIIAQAVYFSIFAITRSQINRLTIPGALLLAVIVTFSLFFDLENKKEIKEKENN